MSAPHTCNCTSAGQLAKASRPTLAHRSLSFASWIVPGATLALLPKCPACLAAYFALWTGIGLSLTTASHVQMLLSSVCVAVLVWLAVDRLRKSVFLPKNTRSTSEQ
jgi:hypothetical protein